MARRQSSIQTFGRISKVNAESPATKKRKASSESPSEVVDVVAPQERKKRCVDERSPQTPIETPTKAISRKLAGLELERRESTAAAKRKSRSLAKIVRFGDTPPTSPSPQDLEQQLGDLKKEEQRQTLPQELQDLIALNSSLLTALALHYAHHGTASPLNVRQLIPSMTKIWGKRKVDSVDIKRCLGLLQSTPQRKEATTPFQLFDYGHNKICIELQGSGNKSILGSRFDHDQQTRLFDQRLEDAWKKHCLSAQGEDDAATFIEGLPLAVVSISPTAAKTVQVISLARGQKRLEEVLGSRDDGDDNSSNHKPSKRRRMQKTDSTEAKSTETSSTVPAKVDTANGPKPVPQSKPSPSPTLSTQSESMPTASSRSTSLLARILEKQSLNSSLPTASTKAEIARLAALQRVSDVSSILDLLVAAKGSGPRASFSLTTLVQSVQGSVRSPLGKTEVEGVLRVMEQEGAAGEGYVKILKMGSVQGVVVDVGRKVGRDEMRRRVAAAGGKR
ncbi:hypothetical protein NA57DRAFT_55265 [Rhizodiscina lignyota]|uniref:DNA replication factor Cdt1 C-terminal domain-containing protein n=1 Tax=Rhizodiscina lignyota TaxID=1504668 RepID=A0A9P4IGN9_9PEZI|nr:hypothetical protein NA57DRAFT_55265 [Rhizodiscina lignyota]